MFIFHDYARRDGDTITDFEVGTDTIWIESSAAESTGEGGLHQYG